MRSGETVSHLAARYGTSVSAIISANNLGSNALIRIGQSLTIPGSGGSSSSNSGSSSGGSSSGSSSSGSSSSGSSSGGASSSGSSNSATTHTVRSGDTLWGISRQYGVSIDRIASANGLTGATLQINQRLSIPAPGTRSDDDLIGNTFLHYTYPDDVVAAANENKRTLLSMNVPGRDAMRDMVRKTARDMGVDPALAMAVAEQESRFDQQAVSPANAIGTMQVIPASGLWAGDLVGRPLNLLDAQDNVTAGVAILRQLQRTSDDLETAIASYYQGQGSVRTNGMYSDTRTYVDQVKERMTHFQ